MGLWTPAATTTPALPRFCTRERTVARLTDGLAFSSFSGPSGDAEHYITVEAPGELSLQRQLDVIAQRYAEAMQALRLPPETAIFRRLYLSDAANQAALVRDSSLFQEPLDSPVAVSLVQQPPLPGAKVAMLAYHLDSRIPVTKRSVPPGHVIVEKAGLGHLWSTRLCATNTAQPSSPADQTREVFGRLIDVLVDNGAARCADNCVRTWIYVKDVDVFYQEMVASRSALFEQHGLTRDTHYIASTGIEGACAHRYDAVLMDAYSILGLLPGAGVLPERPTTICAPPRTTTSRSSAARASPTPTARITSSPAPRASTATGKVVHPGDVQRQLERALENVDALLRSGDAGLERHDASASSICATRPTIRWWRPISPSASPTCRG